MPLVKDKAQSNKIIVGINLQIKIIKVDTHYPSHEIKIPKLRKYQAQLQDQSITTGRAANAG